MKNLLWILLIVLDCSLGVSQNWSARQIAQANTAKDIGALTEQEKAIIMYVNLARMYPKKYASIEVENNDYEQGSDYRASLIDTLRTMEAAEPLHFDAEMYALAKCFAVESGLSGHVGHERDKCTEGFMGECCAYGHAEGRMIVLQLLIDHDVPSLGHREICLSDRYEGIGVSIQPHKEYRNCAVLDFK